MKTKPENYFKNFKRVLFFCGVAFYEIPGKFGKWLFSIYSVFVTFNFVLSFAASEGLYILYNYRDFSDITSVMGYFLAHALGIFKFIRLWYKRKTMRYLLEVFGRGYFLPDVSRGGEEEVNIVQTAVNKINRQTGVLLLIVSFTLLTRIISTAISNTFNEFDREFPFNAALPFDVDIKESPYFELWFIFVSISIFVSAIFIITHDLLINAFTIHVETQFQILYHALLRLDQRAAFMTHQHNSVSKEKCTVTLYSREFVTNLKLCLGDTIRHHQLILEVIEIVENNFNFMLLIQFLSSLAAICVCLYQTSLYDVNSVSFLYMINYTLGSSFQLALYCWNGHNVSLSSVRISDAAFQSQWIPADKDFKLSLVMMMMRSQRASYFTAGKFAPLSLQSYISILRGSFSYFTVLRKINE